MLSSSGSYRVRIPFDAHLVKADMFYYKCPPPPLKAVHSMTDMPYRSLHVVITATDASVGSPTPLVFVCFMTAIQDGTSFGGITRSIGDCFMTASQDGASFGSSLSRWHIFRQDHPFHW